MCKIILPRVVVSDEINNRKGRYEIGGIVNIHEYNNICYARIRQKAKYIFKLNYSRLKRYFYKSDIVERVIIDILPRNLNLFE